MRAPEFWTRDDLSARALALAFAPLGLLYGSTVARKARRAHPIHARAKVVCVGNLTVGGTGKTPVAIAIAGRLAALGHRPVFLSRGYGGRERGPSLIDAREVSAAEVGDEPLLLAGTAPVIVARDRVKGAALADDNGFDTIVMDDGHQNFALRKDLSIVVVDARTGFGNGGVVPAGPLREPVRQGLSRADAVVLVGPGAPALPGYDGPVLRARLMPTGGADLQSKPVLAFAGIGRPEKFFETLRLLGAEIHDTRAYADHHAYTASEIGRLKSRARQAGALLITTEKDYVRLAPVLREGIAMLPIEARFDDPGALDRLIAALHEDQA